MASYKNKIALVFSIVLLLSIERVKASNESKPDSVYTNFVKNYLAGDYAIRHNNHEEASKIFLKASNEAPNNKVLLSYSYSLHQKLGKIDKSVDLAEKYLKIAPTDSNINILRATKAIKNKEYDKAEEILNISTKHEPITVASSINRVILPFLKLWVKIGQGKNSEAILEINEKIESSSAPSLFTHYQKALISDFTGDTKDAKDSFSNVMGKDAILPYHFIKSAGKFYERIG